MASCDTEDTRSPEYMEAMSCKEEICAILVEKAPLVFRIGKPDWRTIEACKKTFGCGDRHDECREAVQALPTTGKTGFPPLSNEGVTRIRQACRRRTLENGTGGGRTNPDIGPIKP